MSKFINGRFYTDAELYPEQFMELPEEAEPKKRNHAVKLGEFDLEDGRVSLKRGKSPENEKVGRGNAEKLGKDVSLIIGGTAPAWKNKKISKDAVNPTDFDDDSSIESIYAKKCKETACTYAMKVVAAGAVTERKLIEKLKVRDYSEEDIEKAVEYVKSFGYVNDQRLAQDMLDKLAARLWGRYKICYYLKGKGIGEEVIDELDFSEIDFPYYCARLMKKYSPERRDAMLRAVKNAGYTSDDLRMAREMLKDEE